MVTQMALEIAPALETTFQEADRSEGRLDVNALRAKLVAVMTDLPADTPELRKGNFALVGALDFQHRVLHADPVWEMHWQPLSTAVDAEGNARHSPEARVVDDEIVGHWSARAEAAHHPVLRSRYADLAWELPRFRHRELKLRPDVTRARTAIDGYLDSVERSLTADDFDAWNDIGRALELATTINDAARMERAKRVLLWFLADCEARDPRYAFWRFDDIAWSQSRALKLNDDDRATIVAALERQLGSRSKLEDPTLFDPHVARDAADRLGRWRDLAGEQGEARRAAHVAGRAFEAAAGLASGLTAITWLGDQAARYRQLGDQESVARVERAIRERADAARGEMKRFSVPLSVTSEEVSAWADQVAGETLDEGLRNFAGAGLIGQSSSESAVLKIAELAPLSAHIPISIMGDDGFTRAVIGSVKDDLDGRTVHHAAQLLSQKGPFLNVAWKKLQERHGADLNKLCEWLARNQFFPVARLRFVREGLAAWLAGDMLKAVHVMVPHAEAALRDVLAALGGGVTRPDTSGGGFHVVLLGDVLNHERFKAHVPEDVRFHFKVLYQDPRGLNVRNELAHGLAAFELFGLGLANLVVHSIILIGTFRVQRDSAHEDNPTPN